MAGGLQEVRERITSVQNTMQITSAMKMVSAAKLRRAQDAITQMRPYAVKLKGMLENVSASLERGEGQYSEVREVKRVLIVSITSNRGLCGAFNNNIWSYHYYWYVGNCGYLKGFALCRLPPCVGRMHSI